MGLPLKQFWALLVHYLRPQKGRVTLLLLLLLTAIGMQLANPQIIRYFLDTVAPAPGGPVADGLNRLLGAAVLFITVALLRQFITVIATYVGENVAWTATNNLRADLALHCLKLDMTFHKQHKPGELIERVDGDVNQLANFFSQLVIRLGSNLVLVAGVLALLWWEDWRIGLSITAVSGVGLLLLRSLNLRAVPRWQQVRQVDADLFGFVEEQLTGAEEIQTNRAAPYVMRQLYELMRRRWQAIIHAMRLNVIVITLPLGIFAVAYAAAHILGASLFFQGAMTIGGIYLIFHYIEVIKGPLWEIMRQVEDLQRATAGINRISELRQIQPTLRDGPGAPLPTGPLAARFDDVTFYYEDDPKSHVLRNVDFQLAPGRVLGLLGRTGSGKSTLTKLLFRFYDPAQGAIYLGDAHGREVELREARLADLRQRMGMVTQEVQLFRASVRHNLTLFDETIADARISEVLQELGLAEWLAQLPEGLDTLLESGVGGLSAGQAQLLAFARVFLVNPGLVILDEASSRLDPVTEQLVERAIDKLLVGRTAVIVAHRLRTVQRADEIMILENGRILEHGLRVALAADPHSRFYALLQTGLEEAIV